MDCPDFKHIVQLRKYLWQWPNSRAALMVGSGFSLNSKPSPGVTTRFPLWGDLARAMFDEIYPALPTDTPEEKEEREKRFRASNPLRIASEYEATFTRPKLTSLLHDTVPDSSHQPGDLHTLLLQLPWRDVFTTNYDTLLERTEVLSPVYHTVTAVDGLPTAFSPRIVKLHGSFRSGTPLIITEEDYRTYTRCFAPFVNTVRQSLIENVIVLIGFSGDDPNFLEWTGWIRDELEGNHAPIYLVGALSLSDVERLLLGKRGVTPIDLSPILATHGPYDNNHAAALDWFLRSLWAGKSGRPERWPEVYVNRQLLTSSGPPITAANSAVVEDEQEAAWPELEDRGVTKLFERWRRDRNSYPGWLVATDEVRSLLWGKTRSCGIARVAKFVEKWSAPERLLLFRELNWRLEIALVPLFPDSIWAFEAAVNDYFASLANGQVGTLKGPRLATDDVPSQNVAKAWLEIAFALLREARETYDKERWEDFHSKIEQVIPKFAEYSDRYHYERALWLAWNIERDAVKAVVESWSPSPNSPRATMWKAGLLAELGELNESRSLLRVALQQIRSAIHKSPERQNIDLLSLEGWCTYLLYFVEVASDPVKYSDPRDEFSERWHELKEWDCNPWPIKGYFDKVLLENEPVQMKEREVVREFDPGRRTATVRFGQDVVGPLLPAFACVRLYEQVGIPMCLPNVDIAGKALRNAGKWISSSIGSWGPAITIRTGNVKELTEGNLMSRTQVAAMTPTLATSLNEWAMNGLRREVSAVAEGTGKQQVEESLVKTLTEALSRLTIKLGEKELQEALSMALKIHSHPALARNPGVMETCRNWFTRVFEAADDEQLLAWLPELIKYNLGNQRASERHELSSLSWDPVDYVPIERMAAATKNGRKTRSEISKAINSLLERCKGETGEAYAKVVTRLVFLFDAGLLTKTQRRALGGLLWRNIDSKGLPLLVERVSSRNLLRLAPVGVDAITRVRAHCLALVPDKRVSRDKAAKVTITGRSGVGDRAIIEWAVASKAAVENHTEPEGLIEWTTEEALQLWKMALEWWDNDKVELHYDQLHPSPFGTVYTVATLRHLEVFLVRAVLPVLPSTNEKERAGIRRFLKEARENGVYLTTAALCLQLQGTEEREATLSTILGDLLSDDEKAVEASSKAIVAWVYLADKGDLEAPPKEMFEGLIRRVIFRRVEGLHACVDALVHLLVKKPEVFVPEQVYLMVSSLRPWNQYTALPIVERRDGDFPAEARPELRTLLGRLAGALSSWLKGRDPGSPEHPDILVLRESFESDPLPEVRRSLRVTTLTK